MQSLFVHAAYLSPLLGAVLIGAAFRREKPAFALSVASQLVSLASVLAIAALWLAGGREAIAPSAPGHLWVEWDLGADGYSIAFLLTLGWIGMVATIYSRRYLHREEGASRFFAIMNMFNGAMALLFLSRGTTPLFASWEIVGTASFLLIAFYHRRESASRAALTAFTVYRICDAALLCAGALILAGPDKAPAWLLSSLIVVGAMGKSGQFPFTFWVARAMEGPSSSSAFFYGAMSTHAGVFILLRLMPHWQGQPVAHAIVAGVGLVTALTSTWMMRAQTNLKGRIAYAGTTQTGIMMMELAAGLPALATVHFVGNAALRCYQLLATPAIAVSRMQAGRFERVERDEAPARPSRAEVTGYVLALRECAMPEMYSAATACGGIGCKLTAQGIWNLCLLANLASAAGVCAIEGVTPWALAHAASAILAWALATGVHLHLRKEGVDLSPGEFAGGATTHPAASRLGLLAFLILSGFPLFPMFLSEDHIMEQLVSHSPAGAALFALSFVATGVGAAASFCRVFHGPARRPAPVARAVPRAS